MFSTAVILQIILITDFKRGRKEHIRPIESTQNRIGGAAVAKEPGGGKSSVTSYLGEYGRRRKCTQNSSLNDLGWSPRLC